MGNSCATPCTDNAPEIDVFSTDFGKKEGCDCIKANFFNDKNGEKIIKRKREWINSLIGLIVFASIAIPLAMWGFYLKINNM